MLHRVFGSAAAAGIATALNAAPAWSQACTPMPANRACCAWTIQLPQVADMPGAAPVPLPDAAAMMGNPRLLALRHAPEGKVPAATQPRFSKMFHICITAAPPPAAGRVSIETSIGAETAPAIENVAVGCYVVVADGANFRYTNPRRLAGHSCFIGPYRTD